MERACHDALAALGHPGRLAVFRLLARRAPHGVRPGEMLGALGLKPSTLSAHLAALERARLVEARREGRSILYSVGLEKVGGLIDFLVNNCCRGRPELCVPLAARSLTRIQGDVSVTDQPFAVLFLCTGNSARSLLAEAILSELGKGRFRSFSAGTRPRPEVNPLALDVLRGNGHDVSGLRPKDLTPFEGPGAPALDFVFTLCDSAANDDCPVWPGHPISAHWGMPDPAQAGGTPAERALAFKEAYRTLHRRLSAFVELPVATLDRISLQHQVDIIGADATAGAR